jgi:branched-chain amino acid transport system substrate-binding protein
MIKPDMDEYLAKLGYDVDVQFFLDNAGGQANVHLEKVQSFHSAGTDLIIGGKWSSQAQASLSYVNANDMLLVSPGSTSPTLGLPNDNLLRLSVNDINAAPAIAGMLDSWGIEAMVFLQRGDSWADGIYAMVSPELEKKGIVELDRVRYATESTEFANYLQVLDTTIAEAAEEYGIEHIGLMTSCFDEIVTIITQAEDFENLNSIKWFGHESAGRNQRVVEDAPQQGLNFRIFATNIAPSKSNLWNDFQNRIEALIGYQTTSGSTYDAAWLVLHSVLDTQSLYPPDVIDVMPDIAKNYYGVIGRCQMDVNGDLLPSSYEFWGYIELDDGTVTFAPYGIYDFASGEATWYTDVLASQGLTKPD